MAKKKKKKSNSQSYQKGIFKICTLRGKSPEDNIPVQLYHQVKTPNGGKWDIAD